MQIPAIWNQHLCLLNTPIDISIICFLKMILGNLKPKNIITGFYFQSLAGKQFKSHFYVIKKSVTPCVAHFAN